MKKSISIIGGGSAAIALAAMLDETKYSVTIYEQKATLGRKFLVAGDGGLNITHSENLKEFILRYSPTPFFEPILNTFSNINFIEWLDKNGIKTFVGSSKRIFPLKTIKPIDVLNTFLTILKNKNVTLKTKHTWKGWNGNELIYENENQIISNQSDITIFALGGSSWKKTGSDGLWLSYFSEKGIQTKPFQASNCAHKVQWKSEFINKNEGAQLKNITLTCGNKTTKGELVITTFGIEGGIVYALSSEIRKELSDNKVSNIYIDLKPTFTQEDVLNKLIYGNTKNIKKLLTTSLNLSDAAKELLKTTLTKEEFTNLEILAKKIKQLPLIITDVAPIDEAISTVGGIALLSIDNNFELKKLPNTYCIGEMLDWDAPTGGYLLQGCFSMGYCLAVHLNSK